MRRLPPVVRRQWGPLRLEWFARLFSIFCDKNGDRLTDWLMYLIEGDMHKLFPNLETWGARKERHIPTVDRDGLSPQTCARTADLSHIKISNGLN